MPSWRLTLVTVLSLGFVTVLLAGTALAVAWFTVELPEESEVAAAQTSIVYWNDGETEMARLGDTNRISIPLSQVPETVQHAVLAAEDRTYYEHGGFSLRGVVRAAWSNVTTGTSQGGSTVTQQYTKNAYLSSEKTYSRKLKELVLSMKLETQVTKDQILERYLNTIFFGRGAYGIETASEAYFGVPAQELSLAQGAVLASIINAPGQFNPDSHRDRLEERYAYVLDGMLAEGWITQKQHDKAIDHFPRIVKRKTSPRFGGSTGHLIAAVEKELDERGFTEEQIDTGGLRIVTTFDRDAQAAAVRAVEEAGPTTGTKGLRIGLASVDPGTGEVVALYGGADYLEDSLNNATQAIQQAGSTFKPFALVAAVEAGIGLQSQWPGNSPHTTGGWTFQNFGNTSYGSSISLQRATDNSVNSAYVEVAQAVGVPAVHDAAIRAGIPAATAGFQSTDDPTLVLGTASPHTLDIASAYATLAAGGVHRSPAMIRSVELADGTKVYKRSTAGTRTISQDVADVVSSALQSVARNGTGRPALALGRPVAVKTGSTDEYRSAWFAGYTPQLATAVSFSKADAKGNPVSLNGTGGMPRFFGSGYPAAVWTSYMRGALEGQAVQAFHRPDSMPNGRGLLPDIVPTPTPTPTPSASSSGPASPSPSASSPSGASASPRPGKDRKPSTSATPRARSSG